MIILDVMGNRNMLWEGHRCFRVSSDISWIQRLTVSYSHKWLVCGVLQFISWMQSYCLRVDGPWPVKFDRIVRDTQIGRRFRDVVALGLVA